MRVILLPALLISFPCVGTLRGQPANAPRLGQTVRVWAAQPPLSKQAGSIVAPQGDSLHLRRRVRPPNAPPVWDTLHVAWSSVQRLEVRRVSHAWGAFKGFFWGFGAGYLFGFVLEQGRQSNWAPIPTQYVTGVAGMAIGTFLGAIIGSESWRRVYP